MLVCCDGCHAADNIRRRAVANNKRARRKSYSLTRSLARWLEMSRGVVAGLCGDPVFVSALDRLISDPSGVDNVDADVPYNRALVRNELGQHVREWWLPFTKFIVLPKPRDAMRSSEYTRRVYALLNSSSSHDQASCIEAGVLRLSWRVPHRELEKMHRLAAVACAETYVEQHADVDVDVDTSYCLPECILDGSTGRQSDDFIVPCGFDTEDYSFCGQLGLFRDCTLAPLLGVNVTDCMQYICYHQQHHIASSSSLQQKRRREQIDDDFMSPASGDGLLETRVNVLIVPVCLFVDLCGPSRLNETKMMTMMMMTMRQRREQQCLSSRECRWEEEADTELAELDTCKRRPSAAAETSSTVRVCTRPMGGQFSFMGAVDLEALCRRTQELPVSSVVYDSESQRRVSEYGKRAVVSESSSLMNAPRVRFL